LASEEFTRNSHAIRTAHGGLAPMMAQENRCPRSVRIHQLRNTSGGRCRQRQSRLLRAGVLAAAATVIALLATACSGSSSTSSGTGLMSLSSLTDQALAYAKCMRSHGITNFPDPTVQDNAHGKGVGFNMPSGVDPHSAQFTSASKLCQQQTGFGHISPAQLQAGMNAMLKYSECMRSHGIANFPDPQENSHQIGFSSTAMAGIDQNSPRFKTANKTCQPLLPGGGP